MFIDICNTLFLFGILQTWCGSGPPIDHVDPVVHPEQGTVLSTSCDGTTLVEEIADGNGGSTTLLYMESTQCGYTPPVPEAGTLLREGCSKDYPGVKWFQYADGEGGTYSEKDNKSVECGWEPPTLVLELEKAEGDRFKPAIVNVNYTDFLGREEPWGMVHASTTLGHIERDGNNILVYGTGQTGEGILTLGREQILFNIVEEPRCARDGLIDCQGYYQSGPPAGYIYYGEDDDQIVEWEIAYFIYDSEDPEESGGHRSHITELFEKGSTEWNKVQKTVDKYNQAYERSGIHIRYVLKEGNVGRMHYHGSGGLKSIVRDETNADVGIGIGSVCPDTCGCAHVNKYFQENTNIAPVGLSRCGAMTDLHEIGHSVGLAHGPENSGYPNSGYIWSEFGHGWASLCGRSFPDIMSYDSGEKGHHNSRLTCGEMYGDIVRGDVDKWSPKDDPAGYRDYADAAYHLNRIRYDVSLINCEDNKCADSAKAYFPAEQDYFIEGVGKPLELIEDYIYDFEDGFEELERERQRLQWFDSKGQLD